VVAEHPEELAAEATHLIANGGNVVLLSAAVVWEIEIKQALGKLDVPRDSSDFSPRSSSPSCPCASITRTRCAGYRRYTVIPSIGSWWRKRCRRRQRW
jgi:PIN domain nuclease of toxin-antitoxin system